MNPNFELFQALLQWCYENQTDPLKRYLRKTAAEIIESMPVWDKARMGVQ